MRPDLAHAAAAIYVVVATVATATPAVSADRYVLSVEGGTCTAACAAEGLHCNWHLETHDSPQLFEKAGIHCNRTMQGGHWWAEDQPSYVAGLADPNHGDCLGYVNVPPCVECEGHYASYFFSYATNLNRVLCTVVPVEMVLSTIRSTLQY
eukprot:COSAG01_NODE_4179_length_5265_cov_15.857917_1_plen_150_part_10